MAIKRIAMAVAAAAGLLLFGQAAVAGVLSTDQAASLKRHAGVNPNSTFTLIGGHLSYSGHPAPHFTAPAVPRSYGFSGYARSPGGYHPRFRSNSTGWGIYGRRPYSSPYNRPQSKPNLVYKQGQSVSPNNWPYRHRHHHHHGGWWWGGPFWDDYTTYPYYYGDSCYWSCCAHGFHPGYCAAYCNY